MKEALMEVVLENQEIMEKTLPEITDVKILYVEDDKDMKEMLSATLSYYFKTVYIASDGLEGLALYEEKKPDVIVCDLRMPKMSGLEMAKKIRETDKSIPIIVTTAFSDMELVGEAIDAGVIHYLVKPIIIQDLLDSIEKSLRTSEE